MRMNRHMQGLMILVLGHFFDRAGGGTLRNIERHPRLPEDNVSWRDVDASLREWFCAASAINRKANRWNVHKFGGFAKWNPLGGELSRMMFASSWNIFSRRELIETIQDMSEQMRDVFATQKKMPKYVMVWQLQRLIQISSSGYIAGYLTLGEALNTSFVAGKRLQQVVSSWDELAEGYVTAYNEFMDEEGAKLRADVYQELKQDASNPCALVPFDLELRKTW
ncbi:Protein of unknown function [Selenomonas sp. GACV-9]|uniref:DUF1266 domain-containing protein n=1 Tax=Selenomonas sp. GACV-9 TaxID=3158782 RepID=UPI0008E29287|nr:Protein of unknown function [Selenomonas ruminantium]